MTPSSRSLRVIRRRIPGATVLTLVGSLDFESSAVLTQEVKDLIGEGERNVGLDLSAVAFLSSSGVAALVRVKRLLEDRHGRLVLFGPSEEVRMVFQLTRVVDYFEIHPDEARAVDALTSPPDA